MKVARVAIAVVSLSLVASFAMAQPGQGRGRGRGGMDIGFAFDQLKAAVEKLDLTDSQKEKLTALKDEYSPKVKALREKADAIYTDDQKALIKKVRDAKTTEDRRAAMREMFTGMNLTDDQRKQLDPINQDGRKLLQEVRGKVNDVLTDEQKKKLQESMPGRRGGGRNRGGQGGGQPAAPDA